MPATFMTIFYSAAAAVIIFSLAMSFGRAEGRQDQTIGFTALLLALLAHILGELLISSGAYAIAPHLVGAELSVRMVLGPAIVFFTQAMVSPTRLGFGGRDWFALLGPILVLLVSLPFSRLSTVEKLALADPATRDPAHFQIALFTCTAGVFLFLVFTTYYLVKALRLQARHRQTMMDQFANIEHQSLDWLRNVLLMFSGVWLFMGIKQMLWVSGVYIPLFQVTLAFFEMASIGVFAFLALRQPALSFDPTEAAPVPRTAILTEAHMARIAAKLITAMQTDRLYAQSDISLRKLSDITGATKNHISETLSQHLGVNFFDFVNRFRIDEARRLLVETDDTVLAIGFEVGFNSRSTFNAAFRKHGGSTPSAYRTRMRAQTRPALKSVNK